MPDFLPYAVYRWTHLDDPNIPGWGEPIWTGDANGWEDALQFATDTDFRPGRYLTVCVYEGFPHSVREVQLSIARKDLG